jgi:hypothetical protein
VNGHAVEDFGEFMVNSLRSHKKKM